MAFVPKDWKDAPSTNTPISAAALEDMESRLGTYTDAVVGDPVQIGSGLSYDTTDPQNPILNVAAEGPWIEVNSGGVAPAFENGAVNYGSGFATAAFLKLRNGIVLMRGTVVCASATIFTLPVGYRPSTAIIIPAWLNSGVGTLGIYPAGSVGFGVAPSAIGGLNGWFWAGP